MKTKFLSALLCAVMLVGFSACEEETPVPLTTDEQETPNEDTLPADSVDVSKDAIVLTKVVAAYLTASVAEGEISNYYIVLSDNENARFDSETSTFDAKDARLLFLDIYSDETGTTVLESGSYTAARAETQSGNYLAANTYYAQYDADGKEMTNSKVRGAVQVTRLDADNNYRIKAFAADGSVFVFEGRINFIDSNTGGRVYPQIEEDLVVNPTAGWAIYNGNLYDRNTGEMMLNLFDCKFNEETGTMLEAGHDVVLQMFNKLFPNPKNANIVPGVYTVARNFSKETFFPGMEIDYMGTTMVFGSYVKRRKAVTGAEDDYDYTYLTNGTVTVTSNDDGTFNFDLDLMTADGFTVKGRADHVSVKIIDKSDDKKVAISNLTDDVALDLSEIDTARIYNYGANNYPSATVVNGCRSFTLDIGSPSGKDFVFDAESNSLVKRTDGDIFRVEFLVKDGYGKPLEGVYTLMEYDHHYTNMYEPFKLVQGCLKDVDFIGTRYQHFEEGRYLVQDLLAPAVEGQVSLEKIDDAGNYKIIIDVYDDAGWNISGEWTGYIKYMYDVDAITATPAE